MGSLFFKKKNQSEHHTQITFKRTDQENMNRIQVFLITMMWLSMAHAGLGTRYLDSKALRDLRIIIARDLHCEDPPSDDYSDTKRKLYYAWCGEGAQAKRELGLQ